MVQVLLPQARPLASDAADALAVAICHAHNRANLAENGREVVPMIAKLTGLLDSVGPGLGGYRRLGLSAIFSIVRPGRCRDCPGDPNGFRSRSRPMCAKTTYISMDS